MSIISNIELLELQDEIKIYIVENQVEDMKIQMVEDYLKKIKISRN